jgi:glycosyltransferase involved in cell wall biosynthesis
MNKEYVLLGGLLWKLWKKRIMLWYNHRYGNLFTALSVKMADAVFYTSPFSFAAEFKKARRMPAGIDTEKFNAGSSTPKTKNSILCLGRISSVKNVDVLIRSAKLLEQKGINFVLNIAGEPGEKDEEYFVNIKEAARGLETKGKVKFLGKVPNYKTPEIYNQNEIFINLTNSGSLDKTALEAMSCENLVIVCNQSYENIFPFQWHNLLIFKENDEKDLADKIINLINLNEAEKKEIGAKSREIVIRNHSLDKLVNNIFGYDQ